MMRFACIIVVACGGAITADAVFVRYFFSEVGLVNPLLTDSAAIVPSLPAVDPVIDTSNGVTAHRLYLWAQIGNVESTDLKGFDLAFRTTGDVEIVSGNIWQNNFVPAVTTRWNPNGFPGEFFPDTTGQFANPSATVAVLEAGVTNGAFAAFDDQWAGDPLNAALVGYLEVDGTDGEVHIINNGSGFLQSNPANHVFLGLDDTFGFLAEVPGNPSDSADPEAVLIPEPASLSLVGLVFVLVRKTR